MSTFFSPGRGPITHTTECATVWFGEQMNQGWTTCPMTQCGFVRISSNPRLSQVVAIPLTAWKLLSQLTTQQGHVFWPDIIPAGAIFQESKVAITGHQQITDAYLIALSIHYGGKLATFDRAAASLGDSMSTQSVELIRMQ